MKPTPTNPSPIDARVLARVAEHLERRVARARRRAPAAVREHSGARRVAWLGVALVVCVAAGLSWSASAASATPARDGAPVASDASADGWRQIVAPLETSFPRDHGAHDDTRVEWWYLTGLAASADGAARFGWQLTWFRLGLDPSPRAADEPLLSPRQLYSAHLAVVDLSSGRMLHGERSRRAVPALAWSSSTDLDLGLDGWTLRRETRAGGDVLRASATDRETGLALDLELVPAKPAVRHGRDGISVKGPGAGNASAYVSWTRIATSGTVTVGGRTTQVKGETWFDHEWGSTQLGAGVSGWDWFGLRFADGRELMLYRLRTADGATTPESSGTWIERDGSTRHLAREDVTLRATSSWTSPRSNGVYPARWELSVAGTGLAVAIEPMAADCELDGRASTGTIYWEGPVRVSGSVAGEGYAELTGYAGSMAGRF